MSRLYTKSMQRYQQTLILVYSTSAAKWRGANDVKVASFARRLKIRHFSEKRTCVAGLCQTFCGLDRAVYGVAATNQLLRAGQRWRKELSTDRLLELEGKCTCCPTMLWTYRGGGEQARENHSLWWAPWWVHWEAQLNSNTQTHC